MARETKISHFSLMRKVLIERKCGCVGVLSFFIQLIKVERRIKYRKNND